MVTEYGADTVAGLHHDPPLMVNGINLNTLGTVLKISLSGKEQFTEDYQVAFIKRYHRAFDELRGEFLVGELIWSVILQIGLIGNKTKCWI